MTDPQVSHIFLKTSKLWDRFIKGEVFLNFSTWDKIRCGTNCGTNQVSEKTAISRFCPVSLFSPKKKKKSNKNAQEKDTRGKEGRGTPRRHHRSQA